MRLWPPLRGCGRGAPGPFPDAALYNRCFVLESVGALLQASLGGTEVPAGGVSPVRSTGQVAALARDARSEIDFVAVREAYRGTGETDMDMPKPGDAHARLHALVGQWGGEERLHPAPWDLAGGAATAFINNRLALDGFSVIQEYEQYRDGRPTFSGHGVFWWDEDAHQYVMTWFDSMSGTPADFRGGFDGDVLQLVNQRSQGGFSRCTFDHGMPGEYVFMLEVSNDGVAWAPSMEGAYGLLDGPTPGERKARVAQRATARRRGGKVRAPRAVATKGAKRRVVKAATTKAAKARKTVAKAAAKSTGKKAAKKAPTKAVKKAVTKAARGKK